MSRPLLVASVLFVSTLLGCSSDGGRTPDGGGTSAPSASTIPVAESRDYAFTHAGATGVVRVPTAPADPRVAEYEAYRQLAGAIDVTYVVAEIDNTQGFEVVTMYRVVVVTAEGQQIEIPSIEVRLETWRDSFAATGTANSEAYDRGQDLLNTLHPVHPGRHGRLVNAAAQSVPSVAQVYVYPTGGVDRVEGVPQ
jgi:hypothetical protein